MVADRRVIPDPGVQIGPYRILQRTTGEHVVVHEELLHRGNGDVSAVCSSKDEAIARAKRLTEAGAPLSERPRRVR